MSKTTRAKVFKGADGWYFRLVAKGNNETVSESESYVRLEDARHEAEQIVGEDDVEVDTADSE
jgi:uncharacterized protein YegP (UPF0339 family)